MLKSMGIQVLYVQDIFLVPLYLVLVFFFAFMYRNIAYRNDAARTYFIPGLAVKIFGSLAMGAVYFFYYDGGDTFYYYSDARTFYDAIQHSFGLFVKLLLLPAETITLPTYESTNWLVYFRDPTGWMADKVYGIISIFSFHSYPVMAILTAAITFTGTWALFRTFTSLYPALSKQLAMAIFFVPSVFFWGSGILKDSITFSCLGWMTYTAYLVFFKRRKIFSNSLMFLLTGYIAIKLKAYIVISFLPALSFWIFFNYRKNIANQFLRVITGPAVFAVSMMSGFLLISRLGEEYSSYSLENIMATVQKFHQWHGYLAQTTDASGYTLGETDDSFFGIISKIPAAINVTLFRPYLWEVNNIVMLAAAIESAFILGFTLYILILNGIWRTIKSVFINPTLFFCFFFSIAFAFAGRVYLLQLWSSGTL
jgi:hypothetical protein